MLVPITAAPFISAVLPQDIGTAVVVVVADPHDAPARPRIAETGAADRRGAVHLPNRGLAAVVLPQDVGMAVHVEIAGSGDVPARSRIAGWASGIIVDFRIP
jgi:hypothetical protein